MCAMLNRERERRIESGEPTDIESIASACGMSVQDASSAIFSDAPVRSLDESIFDDDGSATLGSTVCDEDEEGASFDRLALRLAIERLDRPRQRLIILRYFRDYSQQRTAEILGLSQVKVSREEKKIMAILRQALS